MTLVALYWPYSVYDYDYNLIPVIVTFVNCVSSSVLFLFLLLAIRCSCSSLK
jgi:hypothetical protein